MLCLLLFGQENDSLTTGNADTLTTLPEPVAAPNDQPENESESTPKNAEAEPENPFLADSVTPEEAEKTIEAEIESKPTPGEAVAEPENPFLADPVTPEEVEKSIESDSRHPDIIMDLSVGINYTNLIKVTPEHYSLDGRYNFQFGVGAVVPFLNFLYAKVAVNYFHASYTTAYTTPDAIDMYTRIKSIEELHYLSVPVDLGMSFDLGKIIPFIYYQCMPALLTSAGRDTQISIHTTFSDTATLIGTIKETKDIVMSRERHQIFMGAGAGLEFFYGYGTIYISGGFRIPLLDPGNKNSSPGRSESSLINIPIALGIRFYL